LAEGVFSSQVHENRQHDLGYRRLPLDLDGGVSRPERNLGLPRCHRRTRGDARGYIEGVLCGQIVKEPEQLIAVLEQLM